MTNNEAKSPELVLSGTYMVHLKGEPVGDGAFKSACSSTKKHLCMRSDHLSAEVIATLKHCRKCFA